MFLIPTSQSQYGSGDRRPPPPSNSLWVGNLPKKVTEAELMDLFRRFEPLGATSQGKRGFRFVSFRRMEDAVAAMAALQGATLRGRPINIELPEKGVRRADYDSDARVHHRPPMARVKEDLQMKSSVELQDDNLSIYNCCDFHLAATNADSQVLHDPPRAVVAYTLEGSPLMFPVEPRNANLDRYYRRYADLIPRSEVNRYLSNLDGMTEFFIQHTAASSEAYRLVVSERDQAIRDRDQARRDLDQLRRNSTKPTSNSQRLKPVWEQAPPAAAMEWDNRDDWW